MDQPYSLWADWLSKFHTWPELIQALWLVAGPATLLGLAWMTLRGARDILRPARGQRDLLIYGVYQDPQGRWTIYRHGRPPEAVDWRNPPPEPIGRGQGVFGRPEK